MRRKRLRALLDLSISAGIAVTILFLLWLGHGSFELYPSPEQQAASRLSTGLLALGSGAVTGLLIRLRTRKR